MFSNTFGRLVSAMMTGDEACPLILGDTPVLLRSALSMFSMPPEELELGPVDDELVPPCMGRIGASPGSSVFLILVAGELVPDGIALFLKMMMSPACSSEDSPDRSPDLLPSGCSTVSSAAGPSSGYRKVSAGEGGANDVR